MALPGSRWRCYFCRCRANAENPGVTPLPRKLRIHSRCLFRAKILVPIWIHQILRAKVLRYLFTHLPDHIPSAKAMDDLKNDVPKCLRPVCSDQRKISRCLERAPGGGGSNKIVTRAWVARGLRYGLVSPTGRRIRDASENVALIAAQTYSKTLDSRRPNARLLIRETRHRNIWK